MAEWMTWSEAMRHALVGPDGFYRGASLPAAHFRTSVTAAPALVAQAVTALLADVQAAIGEAAGAGLGLVDLGAGGGELLAELAGTLPTEIRLIGVDVAPRPSGLPGRVSWSARLPDLLVGLLIAHEYLDNAPVDVVELDAAAVPRVVLVDLATGEERLGAVVGQADLDWLARWWPLAGAPAGTRAEIGRARDAAWSAAVASVHHGIAVAVDYDHLLGDRPSAGTLTGYRRGRQVAPVPDGTTDVTAHVALDACAEAGVAAGATATALVRQAEALRALGVRADRPALAEASNDPGAYLHALAAAESAAELLDHSGLGSFGWLVQGIGMPLPDRLARLA